MLKAQNVECVKEREVGPTPTQSSRALPNGKKSQNVPCPEISKILIYNTCSYLVSIGLPIEPPSDKNHLSMHQVYWYTMIYGIPYDVIYQLY